MAAAKRQWFPKQEGDLEAIVEGQFLGANVGWLAGLVDGGNPSDEVALKQSIALFQEWSLAEWVQSVRTGVQSVCKVCAKCVQSVCTE